MRRPRIVCFDLGNVLVRICRSWDEGCAVAGLGGRAVDARPLGSAEARRLLDDYQRGLVAFDAFSARIAALLGGALTPDEVARVHRAWTRGATRGAEALVARVHAAGFGTAVLSNTCGAHWPILESMALLRAIPVRIASHLVGAVKPEPAAYRAVEAACGCAPADLLLFDDLPENVAGAEACGWQAVRVDPEGDPVAQMETALAPWLPAAG